MVSRSLIHCASNNNGAAVSVSLPRQMSHASKMNSAGESKASSLLSDQTNPNSSCQTEYDRITAKQTPGITKTDLRKSQAWIGNQYRLTQTMKALSSRSRPIVTVVAGGSISLGHGVTPESVRYAERLEAWKNDLYPLPKTTNNNGGGPHKVINVAAHGADMCAMAKRLNILYEDLSSSMPPTSKDAPDLIILEFAVNDYQGQDHIITVDSKTSVFFSGFRELVLCAEVVIYALLNRYPNTAIIFLEMQTAISTRKTGALLHLGVAQQYQIPVISYAEAMFPGFWRLVDTLQDMDEQSFTFEKDQWLLNGGLPGSQAKNANISSAVFKYPHGCSPCQAEHIINQFRQGGCKSICTFIERSSIIHDRRLKCNAKQGQIPAGREECFVPFFAHDAVHPSAAGHAIAKDLIVHTLASAQQTSCEGEDVPQKDVFPLTTFVADDFDQLMVMSDYLVVYDVARIFSRWDKLQPIQPAEGFKLYADDELNQRPGWIATDPVGGSKIIYSIKLPPNECYVVYLAILRSYKGMGTFNIEVKDYGSDVNKEESPKRTTTKREIDSLWTSPISIWSDIQITEDDIPGCSGYCEVTITTNPTVNGRDGNKVKLLTLSARRCSSSKHH